MIANFRTYPMKKKSRVDWIGDVPTHWKVLPLRAVFEEVRDRGRPDDRMLSVTINRGVVPQSILLAEKSQRDSSNIDKSAYKVVSPGDIAYNKMRAWQGAVGVSDFQGIVSPAYVVERPRIGVSSRYFHYLLRTPAFAKEAERWSYGITSDMWSLRPEHFKMIYVCVPPFTEQVVIARFLDYVDRRIQRYIRIKQKLIALLEEQQQAIIHQAVTGQIDVRTGQPYSAYKPSGAKWLGNVPTHWRIMPFKRVGWFSSGTGFPISVQGKAEEEILFAKVSDMNRIGNEVGIANSQNTVSRDVSRDLGAPIFEADTIVFPKVGGALLTNKRRIIVRPSCIDNNLMACVVTGAGVGFIFHLLRCIDLGRMAKPGPVPAISEGEVQEIRIAVPPLREQSGVVVFLEKAEEERESVINVTKRQIVCVKEYRTCLITDVVTGKLDVSEAAAALREVEPLVGGNDLADSRNLDDERTSDSSTRDWKKWP